MTTENTTLEREFDVEALQKMVSESDKDFNIGGPNLAEQAIKASAIDEYHQFIAPVILGDGKKWLPNDFRVELDLVAFQKFDNGIVHLQYKNK